MKSKDPRWWILFTVIALLATGLGSWAIWAFFEAYVSPVWTRAWAIIITVLVPVVGRLCYVLGLTESRGRLKGISQGVGEVVGAATKAISLRSQAAREIPYTRWSEPQTIALPEPAIVVRQRIKSGEVIDL